MDLMQLIKALADETRIRILNVLNQRDLCVCELEIILNINQSNASRHLNKLANAKVVDYYKVSKYVYYKINNNILKEYPFLKEMLEEHTEKIIQCSIDNERLKIYEDSGLSCDDLKDGKVYFDK